MATTFELVAGIPDREKAVALAQTAFSIVDRIEALLSNYVSSSDIGQINAAPVGNAVRVAPETMECLKLARSLQRQTFGLFDVSFGKVIGLWKKAANAGHRPSPEAIQTLLDRPGWKAVRLDPDTLKVTRLDAAVEFDLGGIGKGFALDVVMEELGGDWDEDRILIHSGTSTILAGSPPPRKEGWKVGVGDGVRWIHNRALSASGTAVKGDHIIHPRTGQPARAAKRVWALARQAAVSDAVSTALMLMTGHELREFRARHPEIECIRS